MKNYNFPAVSLIFYILGVKRRGGEGRSQKTKKSPVCVVNGLLVGLNPAPVI